MKVYALKVYGTNLFPRSYLVDVYMFSTKEKAVRCFMNTLKYSKGIKSRDMWITELTKPLIDKKKAIEICSSELELRLADLVKKLSNNQNVIGFVHPETNYNKTYNSKDMYDDWFYNSGNDWCLYALEEVEIEE
jgi:hypothetical protein